jgi:hypothetical protein
MGSGPSTCTTTFGLGRGSEWWEEDKAETRWGWIQFVKERGLRSRSCFVLDAEAAFDL